MTTVNGLDQRGGENIELSDVGDSRNRSSAESKEKLSPGQNKTTGIWVEREFDVHSLADETVRGH